jgi:hypothetical protein
LRRASSFRCCTLLRHSLGPVTDLLSPRRVDRTSPTEQIKALSHPNMVILFIPDMYVSRVHGSTVYMTDCVTRGKGRLDQLRRFW